MSGNKNRAARTVSDVVEESAEVAAAASDEAPQEVAASSGPRVWSVQIPNCLLKERFFVADSAEHAYEQYKALGGITSHIDAYQAKELSEVNPDYAKTVAAYEAARASAK